MKCECNSFNSELVGIFTDFTREPGEAVNFPPPPEPVIKPEEQQYWDVHTRADISISETHTGKVTDEEAGAVGTNYVWMG